MIKLGELQKLTAIRKTEHGFYLKDESDDSSMSVLLPNNEISEDDNIGDEFEVFIYKDSSDRIIATTVIPNVMLNTFASLEVKDITPIGAFLDWGLKKDLLLPFAQQTRKVQVGEKVFVTLLIDKSSRLCATAKVGDYLSCESPYQKDDIVTGTVYEIKERPGAFVAVDDKYRGMLPTSSITSPIKVGDTISAYVKNVRDDGKLTLALSGKAYTHLDDDASLIFEQLKEANGFLPFNDKTDANLIKDKFAMSKNSFKRAIGRLYKEKKIRIEDDGIYQV